MDPTHDMADHEEISDDDTGVAGKHSKGKRQLQGEEETMASIW